MKRSDVLLMVLTAAGGVPFNLTQIIKALYIVQQEAPDLLDEFPYVFRAGDYGPTCDTIFFDLHELSDNGLVLSTVKGNLLWAASVKGADLARNWFTHLPGSKVDYLKQVSEFVLGLSFVELIAAVCKKYPVICENLIFKGEDECQTVKDVKANESSQ